MVYNLLIFDIKQSYIKKGYEILRNYTIIKSYEFCKNKTEALRIKGAEWFLKQIEKSTQEITVETFEAMDKIFAQPHYSPDDEPRKAFVFGTGSDVLETCDWRETLACMED